MSLAYNAIEETPGAWVLWKNFTPSAGTVPFKGILIDWTQNPLTGRLQIRNITYPKKDYTRADVEQLGDKTFNCPYCREGKELVPLPTEMPMLPVLAGSEVLSPSAFPQFPDWTHEWDFMLNDIKLFCDTLVRAFSPIEGL